MNANNLLSISAATAEKAVQWTQYLNISCLTGLMCLTPLRWIRPPRSQRKSDILRVRESGICSLQRPNWWYTRTCRGVLYESVTAKSGRHAKNMFDKTRIIRQNSELYPTNSNNIQPHALAKQGEWAFSSYYTKFSKAARWTERWNWITVKTMTAISLYAPVTRSLNCWLIYSSFTLDPLLNTINELFHSLRTTHFAVNLSQFYWLATLGQVVYSHCMGYKRQFSEVTSKMVIPKSLVNIVLFDEVHDCCCINILK